MKNCSICGYEQAQIQLEDGDWVCLGCWEGHELWRTQKRMNI